MKVYKISPVCATNNGFLTALYEKRWWGWKLLYRSSRENVRLMKNHLLKPSKLYTEIDNNDDINDNTDE